MQKKRQVIGSGTGADTFAPGVPTARSMIAAILCRHAGSPRTSSDLSGFRDTQQVSGFALDAFRWAVETSIIGGKDGGLLL